MLEEKADPWRRVFQRGDHFQRASLEIFVQVAAAARDALAASWAHLGASGGHLVNVLGPC